MEYKRLGRSGLQVSRISLGSWVTFGSGIDDKVAEESMKYAYDQGVNFFDNAEVYAYGKSEIVMGKILKKMNWSRDSYCVSSKVFWGTGGDHPTQRGLSRKHVTEACHDALKRLQVDYLDLYFCHRPDKETPIEETVWTMHNLIQQGKILYWGTSEWSAQEIQEAITVARQYNLIPPTMEQPQYNLFFRHKFEVEYFRLFRDYGLGSTIWSPLASGLLSGKYNNGMPDGSRLSHEKMSWLRERLITDGNLAKVKKLAAIADGVGMSTATLSMAWCLKNPNVSTMITGASNMNQLKANLDVLGQVEKLTPDVMEAIEAAMQTAPVHPEY